MGTSLLAITILLTQSLAFGISAVSFRGMTGAIPVGEVGADVSSELAHRFREPPPSRIAGLNDYKILFVSGIFSDRLPVFIDERIWLQSIGADFELVPMRGSDTAAANLPILTQAIFKSTKPVIIYSQSKGSADFMHAIFQYPQLQKKVRGWVSLQGDFAGTPLADYFLRDWQEWLLEKFMLITDGTMDCVRELTPSVRTQSLRTHLRDIKNLLTTFPVLSIATSAEDSDLNLLLWTLRQWKGDQIFREPNDGMIPTASEILPYAPQAVVDHMDHLTQSAELMATALQYILNH